MNFIDIIIVNYNSTCCLIECVNSILHSLKKCTVKIIVIDNRSNDDMLPILARYPDIFLIKNKKNIGFAKAVNMGIKNCSAPYLLILNPDTIIENGFFDSMINFMEHNIRVGIVGPKIKERNNNIQGSARSFPTPLTGLFGRSSLMSRLFPNNRITKKNILNSIHQEEQIKHPLAVDWVSGACMLVRHSAIKEVGMMDEQFFLYWEDADLCKRMSEKGWSVVYYPNSSIVHYAGESSKNKIRPLLEFHKSAFNYFCKHSLKKESILLKILAFYALSLRFYILLIRQCVFLIKKT